VQYVLIEISRPFPECLSFSTGYNFHNSASERKRYARYSNTFCSAKRIPVNVKEKMNLFPSVGVVVYVR